MTDERRAYEYTQIRKALRYAAGDRYKEFLQRLMEFRGMTLTEYLNMLSFKTTLYYEAVVFAAFLWKKGEVEDWLKINREYQIKARELLNCE